MNKYRVPVYWTVSGYIDVEAETEEDAIGYVQDNLDELELPDVEEYLEDSFEIGDYAYLLEK